MKQMGGVMLSAGRDGLCAHNALRAATQVQLTVS